MYNTIETADSYIEAHYTSTSPERIRWAALSNEDKTVCLNNAFAAIEALPFLGRKAVIGQETAFPRLPYQYGHTDEGAPQNVLAAEAEWALWLSDETKRSSSRKRKELQEDGVKEYKIGDLSETYTDSSASAASAFPSGKCPKAMELLAPYLTGGYETC